MKRFALGFFGWNVQAVYNLLMLKTGRHIAIYTNMEVLCGAVRRIGESVNNGSRCAGDDFLP